MRGSNGGEGLRGMQVFQDTTITKKVVNDPDDEINYTVKNGCFSIAGRTVIPRRVQVEVIPSLTNTAVTGNASENIAMQLQAIVNGQELPAEPFRLVSNINPTRFNLDWVKLAKLVPAARTAYDSDSSMIYCRLKFSGNTTQSPRDMVLKVTHVWDVFPQDSVVVGPT